MLSVDMVIGYYGQMDGPALIRETHSEAPWRDAYVEGRNNPITNEAIKAYYETIFTFTDRKPSRRRKASGGNDYIQRIKVEEAYA
jgi:hypothetical protein